MEPSAFRSRLAIAAAATLLLANVVVPLIWGDVYPFTSAPMFRDSPGQCCNYRVVDDEGRELPADAWLVQRVYDGNPVGYGVGVRPPAVIEQQFGMIHNEAAICQHFERQLAGLRDGAPGRVEVVQEVIGPVDSQRVGVVQTHKWQIARP